MITEDEFSAWRELPITRAFLDKLSRIKAEAEKTWMQALRTPIERLPIVAAECRSRIEFIEQIQSMKAKTLDANRDSDGQKGPVQTKAFPLQRPGPGTVRSRVPDKGY